MGRARNQPAAVQTTSFDAVIGARRGRGETDAQAVAGRNRELRDASQDPWVAAQPTTREERAQLQAANGRPDSLEVDLPQRLRLRTHQTNFNYVMQLDRGANNRVYCNMTSGGDNSDYLNESVSFAFDEDHVLPFLDALKAIDRQEITAPWELDPVTVLSDNNNREPDLNGSVSVFPITRGGQLPDDAGLAAVCGGRRTVITWNPDEQALIAGWLLQHVAPDLQPTTTTT